MDRLIEPVRLRKAMHEDRPDGLMQDRMIGNLGLVI